MTKKRKRNICSAEFETVEIAAKSSFNVGTYKDSYFRRPWHYHPEFELLMITKGYGIRMVGDNFEEFGEGDLVLVGGNLPHAWISDQHFIKDDTEETCESVFIQFRKQVFGTQFIDIPEMATVRRVLAKAAQGLKITGTHKQTIAQQMLQTIELSPIEQMLSLIRILDLVAQSDCEVLASSNYIRQGHFKSEKMAQIHRFIMQNFKHEIDICVCAKTFEMTKSSFCRFFKRQTNVTFSVYLHYLRINLAQKLLRNTQLPIKEIAFESGYGSIVYFNQKFKELTGYSPKQYRERKV